MADNASQHKTSAQTLDERSEHFRFVNDKTLLQAQFRKTAFGMIAAFVIGTLPLFFSSGLSFTELFNALQKNRASLLPLLLIIFGLFLPGLILIFARYHSGRIIDIDNNGIAFSGFLWPALPKRIDWPAISMIRQVPFSHARSNGLEMLLFRCRHGKDYLIETTSGALPVYRGDGHAHTLVEAIGKYAGPIPVISEKERRETPSLAATIDIGQGALHACAFAIVLLFLTIVLMQFVHTRLLDNAAKPFIFGGTAIAAALLTIRYMRKIDSKIAIFVCSLLVSAMTAFLTMPLIDALPQWFGSRTQITFTIVEDNDRQQVWQSIASPDLTLTLEGPRRYRKRKEGTLQTLTIYRGPFGLNAVHKDDRRALTQSPEN